MKRTILGWVPFCLLNAALLAPVAARSDLVWHVSVKMILDEHGNPPSGSMNSRVAVEDQIAYGNEVLLKSGRGYQLELTEYVELPGLSKWFDSTDGAGLEAAAKADPTKYYWRDNAINVYIRQGDAGGCVDCFSGGEIILVGADQGTKRWVILHESGHFLDLRHTHEGATCDGKTDDDCSSCSVSVGGDEDSGHGVLDTLPDHKCWETWADIASHNFPTEYANGTMTSAQSVQVDNVRYNIMSYHSDRDRFTSDQLDHMTDISNDSRNYVATGRTRFVDYSNACFPPSGSSQCSVVFRGPYPTVAMGIAAADAGDIVLVRTGTYAEFLTVTKAVTLRASRGNAIVGP